MASRAMKTEMTETPSNQTEHAQLELRDLPNKVAERCSDWFSHFKFWRRFYFTTGTIGAIVSALAATQLGQKAYLGAYLAVGASICFAVPGFHPSRAELFSICASVACARHSMPTLSI